MLQPLSNNQLNNKNLTNFHQTRNKPTRFERSNGWCLRNQDAREAVVKAQIVSIGLIEADVTSSKSKLLIGQQQPQADHVIIMSQLVAAEADHMEAFMTSQAYLSDRYVRVRAKHVAKQLLAQGFA